MHGPGSGGRGQLTAQLRAAGDPGNHRKRDRTYPMSYPNANPPKAANRARVQTYQFNRLDIRAIISSAGLPEHITRDGG